MDDEALDRVECDLHLGQLIKQELRHQGRKATWLAQQVKCSPDNIYKLFNQRWVAMRLLYEISWVLDYDFFKVCSDHYVAMMEKRREENKNVVQ